MLLCICCKCLVNQAAAIHYFSNSATGWMKNAMVHHMMVMLEVEDGTQRTFREQLDVILAEPMPGLHGPALQKLTYHFNKICEATKSLSSGQRTALNLCAAIRFPRGCEPSSATVLRQAVAAAANTNAAAAAAAANSNAAAADANSNTNTAAARDITAGLCLLLAGVAIFSSSPPQDKEAVSPPICSSLQVQAVVDGLQARSAVITKNKDEIDRQIRQLDAKILHARGLAEGAALKAFSDATATVASLAAQIETLESELKAANADDNAATQLVTQPDKPLSEASTTEIAAMGRQLYARSMKLTIEGKLCKAKADLLNMTALECGVEAELDVARKRVRNLEDERQVARSLAANVRDEESRLIPEISALSKLLAKLHQALNSSSDANLAVGVGSGDAGGSGRDPGGSGAIVATVSINCLCLGLGPRLCLCPRLGLCLGLGLGLGLCLCPCHCPCPCP